MTSATKINSSSIKKNTNDCHFSDIKKPHTNKKNPSHYKYNEFTITEFRIPLRKSLNPNQVIRTLKVLGKTFLLRMITIVDIFLFMIP